MLVSLAVISKVTFHKCKIVKTLVIQETNIIEHKDHAEDESSAVGTMLGELIILLLSHSNMQG
jgi:hypothetical protein